MNYYIFANNKPCIKKKKSKAILKTIDLQNALMHFDKYINEVYDKHLYLIVDLNPKSYTKRNKYMYGEENYNYLIIAEWHLGDSFDIMKSIRSDYITMRTNAKTVEISSNKRAVEFMEYYIRNRIYAEFDIRYVQKFKYAADKLYRRKLMDVGGYLATEKIEDMDPFIIGKDTKYIIDLRYIGIAELPRRFKTFNMKLGKYDQEITEEEQKQSKEKEMSSQGAKDFELEAPKIAIL